MREKENKQLISVDTCILQAMKITFNYNNSESVSCTVSEGDIVNVVYVKNKMLTEIKGKIKRLNSSNLRGDLLSSPNYNIEIDCSKDYESKVISISVSDIREISLVIEEELPEVGDGNDISNR